MSELKPFDYEKFTASWESGEANEMLIKRAQTVANMILYQLDIGIFIDDLPDIDWYNKLWYIHDDDELFDSAKSIVTELLGQSGGSAKERRQFINEVDGYEWNDGIIIK